MLSRVAERMYWIGRYLERTENTARLINVNSNLLLDLPRMVKHIWRAMIDISKTNDLFYSRYDKADEKSAVRFLLSDENNPSSVISSMHIVRENLRATREIMPSEGWELINEFYLYVRQHTRHPLKRDAQYEFLNTIISYCQQMTGLLFGNMSHVSSYNFIRIGRNLERADMTSRIVDVGCMNLLRRRFKIPETYDNILWMNVLRSLSAYQMYRQYVHDRVNGEDVVDFLLKNLEFPRSVAHCLSELCNCVTQLPQNDLPLRTISHVQRMCSDADIHKLYESNLHDFIDKLQVDLAAIHDQVNQTWFQFKADTATAAG
jgi:uncharacterized alpha-E superfamily protein